MQYSDIPNACNFHGFYQQVVNRFSDGIFIEVGVWLGHSAAFMATLIQNKPIRFYAIDDFKSDGPTPLDGDYYDQFWNNMQSCGVSAYITPIVGDSSKMAQRFSDHSCSFVFIDGDHTYEGVKRDIQAFLPKMKNGGILAGHDYQSPTVRQAVHELLNPIRLDGGNGAPGTACWVYDIVGTRVKVL